MGRADKAGYYAYHSHQPERDKLYNGSAGLELACKLGRYCVYKVCAAHIEQHERYTFRPYYAAALRSGDYKRKVRPAGGYEYKRISCGEPAKHTCKRWIIDGRHEPADIIAVFFAYSSFSIVHYAVHLNVLLRHHGKRKNAYKHYHAADYPRQYAQRQIAHRNVQYGLRLKEHAGAYYDADYHAYGCEQTILFLQLIVHGIPPVFY